MDLNSVSRPTRFLCEVRRVEDVSANVAHGTAHDLGVPLVPIDVADRAPTTVDVGLHPTIVRFISARNPELQTCENKVARLWLVYG